MRHFDGAATLGAGRNPEDMSWLGLWLLGACEVVHTTDCVPTPPGESGCNDPTDTGLATDTQGDSADSGTTGPTGSTQVSDTGWPQGEWVAALQWKQLSYDTIQDAISEAADGDTVLVAPGTHYELIDFHGKGIHVRSTHGATATVLDGGGTGSVVTLRAQEPATAILEGFTITGGQGDEDHGGGIFVENADPLIVHNVITGNESGIAGGVYLRHGSAQVWNNVITANKASQGGGGIVCTNCKGGFFYNTVAHNESPLGPAGEWFFEPQGALVGNVIELQEVDTHAMRFMEPLGYTFDTDYNLLWPEVDWVPPGGDLWPEGIGLVYEEPDFEDAPGGDFRLATDSPAIDAGPPDDTDADGSPADLGAFGGPLGDWSPDAPSHPHATNPWDTDASTE
jgi:hypothetical protein